MGKNAAFVLTKADKAARFAERNAEEQTAVPTFGNLAIFQNINIYGEI